ncbi:hypothetical protein Hanom_Chr16g01479151 [Helianthus anomalus]
MRSGLLNARYHTYFFFATTGWNLNKNTKNILFRTIFFPQIAYIFLNSVPCASGSESTDIDHDLDLELLPPPDVDFLLSFLIFLSSIRCMMTQ